MSTTNLTCSYNVQFFGGTEFQMTNEILLVVAVFLVDTLSVHDGGFVGKLAVIAFTKELQTEVTTILHTHQRVVAASQIGDTFRTNVNGLQLSGRHIVFDGIGMLELTNLGTECLVVGEAVRSPVLMHHTSVEVMHEHGEPTVGDGGAHN